MNYPWYESTSVPHHPRLWVMGGRWPGWSTNILLISLNIYQVYPKTYIFGEVPVWPNFCPLRFPFSRIRGLLFERFVESCARNTETLPCLSRQPRRTLPKNWYESCLLVVIDEVFFFNYGFDHNCHIWLVFSVFRLSQIYGRRETLAKGTSYWVESKFRWYRDFGFSFSLFRVSNGACPFFWCVSQFWPQYDQKEWSAWFPR